MTVAGAGNRLSALSDWVELTKPRITLLVALTVAAGFALATPPGQVLEGKRLIEAVVATALVSAGAAALNQARERELDSKMRRTAGRPIPAGRISVRAGFALGVSLALVGTIWLGLRTGPGPAVLALATCLAYVLIYTPLKTKTALVTLIGAIPGATPPLIGWVAASGQLELGGWILFAVQYLWQLPHVIAIAWLYGEEYLAAGIRLLPLVEEESRVAGRQAVLWSAALLPVTLWPGAVGLASPRYLWLALLAGLALLGAAARFALNPERSTARGLILTSVAYLPVVLLSWVLDRRLG